MDHGNKVITTANQNCLPKLYMTKTIMLHIITGTAIYHNSRHEMQASTEYLLVKQNKRSWSGSETNECATHLTQVHICNLETEDAAYFYYSQVLYLKQVFHNETEFQCSHWFYWSQLIMTSRLQYILQIRNIHFLLVPDALTLKLPTKRPQGSSTYNWLLCNSQDSIYCSQRNC